jgi:ketosteroid isomerase-like protein
MTAVPFADSATTHSIRAWLERFSGYVREVDYGSARPMWDEDVIVFGTHNDLVHGRERAIVAQWDHVWPHTADFRFTMDSTEILGGGDMAVAIAPWTSTGFSPDGTKFDRPGRATMIFRRDGEEWRCVHSHMSLNRGVPQASQAGRPVKAR